MAMAVAVVVAAAVAMAVAVGIAGLVLLPKKQIALRAKMWWICRVSAKIRSKKIVSLRAKGINKQLISN
jgi:hypothetical protein